VSDLYPTAYAPLAQQLSPLSLSPAELHGSLCGFVCAGGVPEPGRWLEQLCIDTEGLAATSQQDLESLRRATLSLLDDADLRFAPLLPPDEVPMDQRFEALGQWCGAFLGGFGLTGVGYREGLGDEARDALRDLERIGQFGYEAGEVEEDENAFAEILEYVRMAVLMLHQDAARAHAPPDATRH
jgi:uncharacterized protein YgfB (UPF0149 family)